MTNNVNDALTGISFDEQDANLFLVDDARLRADALKHSVLPRLRVVVNVAITRIREIYGIEALEDSRISIYPSFREKRYKNELVHKYDSAFVGLGGQVKDIWPGFARKDGKPVKFLPFRLGFTFTQEGFFIWLQNGWLKGLNQISFSSLLQFHLDNEDIVNRLCFSSRMHPDFYWDEDLPYFATFKEHYRHRLAYGYIDNDFWGYPYTFPVTADNLSEMIEHFAIFFPVYDAYLQLAKGQPSRLSTLIDALNQMIERENAENQRYEENGKKNLSSEVDDAAVQAALTAENKIRVMPAMRWQVFQRDGWKCVACGRGSHDGAILHVDHIIPRSKGGTDTLDNFQTLCDKCNIGKSNRDMTDLRKKV